MMVNTGSLVTVGTVHLLLLLSCLDTGGSVPVRPGKHDAIFDPSRVTWKDANFTLPPLNQSLLLRFNVAENKLQYTEWPFSFIIFRKGERFSGYAYFKGENPRNEAVKALPELYVDAYEALVTYNKTDYCVAADVHDTMLEGLAGSTGDNVLSSCLHCNSSSCPELLWPCNCGWLVYNKDPATQEEERGTPFVGVSWWGDWELEMI